MKNKSRKGNALAYLYKLTWRFSPKRVHVVVYWTMFIIANLLTLIVHPFVMSKLFETIETHGVTSENIKWILTLLVGGILSTFLFWTFHGPGRVIERTNACRVEYGFKRFFMSGIVALPFDWHINHHSGDTIDKIEKGCNNLYSFSSTSYNVIMFSVRFLVSFCVLSYYNWKAGVCVLALILAGLIVNKKFDKKIVRNHRIISRLENKMSSVMNDSIGCIKTIITLRREDGAYLGIPRLMDRATKIFKWNCILIEGKWFILSVFAAIMYAVALGLYFFGHLNGAPIRMKDLYLMVRYLDELNELFFRTADTYSDIIAYRAKISNAELLSKEFVVKNQSTIARLPDWNELHMKNVFYQYKDARGKTHHLDDVNLKIRRNARIALLGQTGSGKSTLQKIMRRLHIPKSGRLEIDGVDYGPAGLESLASNVSLVPQTPEILAQTVHFNLTLGREYSEEDIERYVRITCFDEVVKKLPKGLNTRVNERGVKLSGGEQQRLALARGLLASKDSPIILLDEPTSSIDRHTACTILRNITREFPDKTLIVSFHQLDLLPFFDEFYFFKDGSLIKNGQTRDFEPWYEELNRVGDKSLALEE